ncbi:ornithine cyclodeaminase [Chitiniphilus shinanonensis]|uniref:Ornithine cyclodeaminase n=1 Tax=Chitiniphilus shinanonensis TaxID=553088 RepID=A0ABQ6BUC1_9NEIS|nr:ornithine cyclodeaminase family protein [Chitiniphilus shinanonensis]GLS05074.1 ornithine cyclodeaminase [Chitiniphilus shinanonensis]
MRFYSDAEIRRVFTPQQALRAARQAFELLGDGHFVFYPRQVYESPTGFIGQMPGYIAAGAHRGFGVKNIVVTKARIDGLPSHNGVVTIFDPDSGMAQAAFDASTITELRTAAMSAFATDRLAAPGATTLALLGAGDQARAHLAAMLAIRPLRRVRVWSRSAESRERLLAWARRNVPAGCVVEGCAAVATAVADADIVCTVSGARSPILSGDMLAPHAHVNAIGASRPGAEELDPSVFRDATVYLDCRAACLEESSEIQRYLAQYGDAAATALRDAFDLCADTARPAPGRTVFKSVGFAAQDLVAARSIERLCQAACLPLMPA